MQQGFFPYTPATLLLFGLREALRMLDEEGLANVFARHRRLAQGTREAVRAWGLTALAREPARASNSLTAVVVDKGDLGKGVQGPARRVKPAPGRGLWSPRGPGVRIRD